MKIAALVGGVRALEERGIVTGRNLRVAAGSSSGAVLAALLASGRTVGEIERLLIDDTKAIGDLVSEDPSKLSLFSMVWRLMRRHGLDDGSKFLHWLEKIFGAKTTFRDLYEQSGGISCLVTATSYTRAKLLTFSPEQTPDMLVVTALRASCSLPGLYSPVEVSGEVLIDGGVLCNFPMRHCRRAYPGLRLYCGLDFDYLDAAASFKWTKNDSPSLFAYGCNVASLIFYRIASLERRLASSHHTAVGHTSTTYTFRIPVPASYLKPAIASQRAELEALRSEAYQHVLAGYGDFVDAMRPTTVYDVDVFQGTS